ncbi:hypothetical protein ACH4UY_35385 [Streptomyces longwoodensis]|uniref:hypothetical protein n=1 Tax=Streptomyces longwoodensis TaxID=68231 RepID=UPI00379882BD
MPAKTLEAVQETVKAAGSAAGPKAQQEAGDAVRAAVDDLYDRAASSSRATVSTTGRRTRTRRPS